MNSKSGDRDINDKPHPTKQSKYEMKNASVYSSMLIGVSPRVIVANALDSDIVVSDSKSSRVISFTFGLIPLGNMWTPLSLHVWAK